LTATTILSLALLLYQAAPASQEFFGHIKWSIWHEGCRVYDPDDRQVPVDQLRRCFLDTQRGHNLSAYHLIETADNATLQGLISQAVSSIPGEMQLKLNFEWVAIHEHQLSAFRRLDAIGQYESIRTIYASLQKHNPNARNLLAAVTNQYIHTLILDLLSAHPNEPTANIVTQRPDDRLVVVDPTELPPQETAATQLQLLNLFGDNDWRTVQVDRPGSLFEWIRYFYDFKDEIAIAIFTERIASRNGIGRAQLLSAGQGIAMPAVPTVPNGPRNPFIVQVIDKEKHIAFVKNVADGQVLPWQRQILASAAGWVFAGQVNEVTGLAPNLFEFRGSAYQGPTHEIGNLVLTSDSSNDLTSATIRCSPATSGNQAPSNGRLTTSQQRYYVLDFFDTPVQPGDCPHGKKVLDVIRQNLREHGAESLFATNVIPIELDFFRHSQTQSHFIEQYISAQRLPATRELLSSVLKALKTRDPNSVGDFETPLLYLQAVYDFVFKDSKASVVSSSFYTESSGFALLPDSFTQNNPVLLMTAVDDKAGNIESFQLEPIRTIYDKRHDYPVLLVGGFSNGSAFGMSSTRSDGVSCLGQGDGWGNKPGIVCIRPADKGTSFATPAVATTAFLTRVFWEQGGLTIAAADARDRLLHAVPILPQITSGYGSPGIPSLAWLNAGRAAVMVGTNGIPTDVISVTGSLSYFPIGSQSRFTAPFQAGDDGISGLQQVGTHTFVFNNAHKRWEEVGIDTIAIVITPRSGTPIPITTRDSLTSTIQAAIVF
jgi:hypothetical protein